MRKKWAVLLAIIMTVMSTASAVYAGNLKISNTVVSDLAADQEKEFNYKVTLTTSTNIDNKK